MAGIPDNQSFTIQNIQNGILSSVLASPQPSRYNDPSVFANNRQEYMKTYSSIPVPLNKKWVGVNQSSSKITDSRRMNAIGTGSLNPNGKPIDFEQHRVTNTIFEAKNRMRNSGYVTTPKVRANQHNNLTPAFPAGPLKRFASSRSVVPLTGLPSDGGEYTVMREKQIPVISRAPILSDTSLYNRARHRFYINSTQQPIIYH